ncbi:unnamed protein product [Clonostachys byssicola]|uniref:Heterokaryon incompatibility domain-containing protein n=1 Tax=Clonostachys byssicola TaxID=160290 RepID=A0A9N9U8B9_9HYPO|nr:unnamed protein product [Clonostachys byssicola]
MRCTLCLGLDIQKLIDYAEVEFSGWYIPKSSFYQHYASIHELEKSADGGCDLCALMIYAFKNSRSDDHRYYAIEDSDLLSAIKEWVETSSIRISIQASHIYVAKPLEEAQMLDMLQISAGEYKETSSDPDESSLQEPPTVFLQLLTPLEHPLKLGRYDIGRFKTDVDLGSDSNVAIAKNWIDTCSNHHQGCPSPDPTSFPTRVIDVGTIGDAKCSLFIPKSGFISRYVALSHCWGGPIEHILLKKTLAEFQTSIHWDNLEANFQDAVTITRNLGLRYLWIDSLCIIQDDFDDWAVESAKMADLYRNAFVTISAMSSPISSHGIFQTPIEVENPTPPAVDICLSNDNQTTVSVATFSQGDRSRVEDLRWLYLYSPLCIRGWCLQESVLSPRILHYGVSQIYWKCSRGFQSADGALPGNLFPENEFYPALSSVLYSDLARGGDSSMVVALDKRRLMDEFYELVNQYTKRKLSYWRDKLPAFSGLAQKMHAAVGGTYLAGIWSEDIRRGLSWQKEMSWARHASTYQAPSWSWATTNDLVNFDNPDSFEDEDNLILVDSDIQLVNKNNPYGAVRSGHIIVRGLTMELWRTVGTISQTELESTIDLGTALWDEPMFEGDSLGLTMRHIREVIDVKTGEQACFLEGIEAGYRDLLEATIPGLEDIESKRYTVLLVSKASPTEEDHREGGHCIILEKQMEEDAYRRVGLLSLFPYPLTRFKGWKSETLKLI